MLHSRPMMARAVVTQHQVLALAEARRAPSMSPWLSSVLTLLENTIATMPTRPSGQHRQVASTVEMIDQARWLGTGPCTGAAFGGGGTELICMLQQGMKAVTPACAWRCWRMMRQPAWERETAGRPQRRRPAEAGMRS